MRILVYEHITGGGLADEIPSTALVREADLMVRALVSDLADLPEVDVVFSRDIRLPDPHLPGEIVWIAPQRLTRPPWLASSNTVDAVWPIAPETNGTLERVCASIQRTRKILLNCPPEAVRLAASKYATALQLGRFGLPVVPTYPMSHDFAADARAWVLKPDDGVGCEGTYLCHDGEALVRTWTRLGKLPNYVVQPYHRGTPASLSLLCGRGGVHRLSFNQQNVEIDSDRFYLRACRVGVRAGDQLFDAQLLGRLAAAIPHLWGYVGVDLIIDSDGPKILEINPRLTTSYAGLRQALGSNPAQLVLGLLHRSDWSGARPTVAAAGSEARVELTQHNVR